MTEFSDLVPGPGERAAIFGGTRAGKSAFQEWSLRTVQRERPNAMQILVDTKPRFRAECEKGLRTRCRRSAARRYEDWASGPVVPHSVVVDLWSDRPFAGTFAEPGEIVILQSGDAKDWKRILELLDGFVKANIKGRERRIVVDECLDFTSATRTASTRETMFYIVRPGPGANGTLESILARIKCKDYLDSRGKCSPESHCFICVMTGQT